MIKNSVKIIVAVLITSLLSNCKPDEYLTTIKTDKEAIPETEEVADVSPVAEVDHSPDKENPELDLRCYSQKRIRYKVRYNKKDRYQNYAPNWTNLYFGSIIGGVIAMASDKEKAGKYVTGQKRYDIFLGGITVGFVWSLFDQIKSGKELKNPRRGRGMEYRNERSVLDRERILAKLPGETKNYYRTDEKGNVSLSVYDFSFPVLQNDSIFNLVLSTGENIFRDSIQLNSQKWMRDYAIISDTKPALKRNYSASKFYSKKFAGKNGPRVEKSSGWSKLDLQADDYWVNNPDLNTFRYSLPSPLDKCNRSAVFSKYFRPRGEFEKPSAYQERRAEGKKLQQKALEKCVDEAHTRYVEKIKNSYEKVTLDIDEISDYDITNNIFAIRINDQKDSISMPVDEARYFKKNLEDAKVTAAKQLRKDEDGYEYFNIRIHHPEAQKVYKFGKQHLPYFTNTSQLSRDKDVASIPRLEATARFIEPSGNNMLDGGEKANIRLNITNNGQGPARGLKLDISGYNTTHINTSDSKYIGKVEPQSEKNVNIEVEALKTLKKGETTFNLKFSEELGFPPSPINLSVETQKYRKPEVAFVEAGIEEVQPINKNNIIENGELIRATVLVQNQGVVNVNDLFAEIILGDENIVPIETEKYPLNRELGELTPSQASKFSFKFSVNYNYSGDAHLPMKVRLYSKSQDFEQTFDLGFEMKKMMLATKNVRVRGDEQTDIDYEDVSLSPDVNKNIPVNEKKSNRYALVVGNQNYKTYQNGLVSEANVDYAIADARIFARYCKKTLGIPDENLFLLTNALSSQMEREITRLQKIAQKTDGEAELYFFYAGHGFPDEQSKDSYLMPVDIPGTEVEQGIKLSELYKNLSRYPAEKITIFLDACFSGGGREKGLLASTTRGVKIKPKTYTPEGNMVVFTASSGSQNAGAYAKKNHGLFTYYLLKKIQDTGGNVDYKTLSEYLKQKVELKSITINGQQQTPQTLLSPESKPEWEEWKIYK